METVARCIARRERVSPLQKEWCGSVSLLAVDPCHISRIMMVPGDDLPPFAAKVGGW